MSTPNAISMQELLTHTKQKNMPPLHKTQRRTRFLDEV